MKLMGAVFVLVAGILVGYISLYEEKNRINRIKELCNATDIMCGEMASKQSPLNTLLICASKNTNAELRQFFEHIDKSFDALGEKSFSDIWKEAAQEYLLFLDGECFEAFLHLGNVLGRYGLEDQLSALTVFKNRLTRELELSSEKYPEKRKLGFGLAASVSTLLIIVLL